MSDIWAWFLELHDGRNYTDTGPNPITYLDIKSWCDLTDVVLRPYEVKVIKDIDRVFLVSK